MNDLKQVMYWSGKIYFELEEQVLLGCPTPKQLLTWADPEGGQGVRISPEKSQKYRVSLQYWSGSPENHKAT